MKNFRQMGKSFFVLYLITILLSLPFAKYSSALSKARSSALSRFMPSLDYLIDFQQGKVAFDKERFEEYLSFYSKVNAYLPDHADVQSALGYCSYYLGKEDAAQSFYRQALLGQSNCFAYHYNLGAILFKKGDYPQALEHLKAALRIPFAQNAKFVSSSIIYLPMITKYSKDQKAFAAQLHLGYERCLHLVILSYKHMNDPENMLAYAFPATTQRARDTAFFCTQAGIASYQLGEYQQALNFFRAALEIQPDNQEALKYLSMTAQALGQKEFAAEVRQRAKALDAAQRKDENEEVVLQLY